ncbi:MAG: hypothetical protein NUW01_09695 [Gemmatimonadaceae bacterium]|nr:hypothetical protein [Gemmatimonadaceae bacterium]
MRVITLPKDRDEAEQAFNLIYTAAFAGEGAKDMAAAKKLGKLQDALDAVSHDEPLTKDEAGNTGEKTKRVLDAKVKTITLDDAWCETLKTRFFGAGIQWTAGINRKVVEVLGIVESAEEVTPADKPDKPVKGKKKK